MAVAEDVTAVPVNAKPAQLVRPPIMGREVRVVLLMATVLGTVELGFHLAGDRLSKDVAHWQSLPQLAQTLNSPGASSKLRLMFLGNSLTRYGVNEDAVTRQIVSPTDVETVQTLKIVPDNSALAEWYHVFRTHFSSRQQVPNVLVIGFEGGHLRDAPAHHLDRIALYSASVRDLPSLWGMDVRSVEDACHFVAANLSSAYGNRDRIQRRLLDTLIPGYREGMDRVNLALKHQSHGPAAEPTYHRLESLLAMAHRDHIVTILVAMPVPEEYTFDPALVELAAATKTPLLDLRHVEGITPAMFFDGLHMDADGARVYSAALGAKLAETLRQPIANSAYAAR